MAEQKADPHDATTVAAGPYRERLAAAVARLQATGGLAVRLDEPMDQHTSLGVGGPADAYVVVLEAEGARAALATARHYDLPVLVTGRGTNLLVRDGGLRGLVLHFGKSFSAVTRDGSRVTAQSGATLAEVCDFAANVGLSGLEFTAGIPGSVGGAVAMNAGAGSGQMADVVETVEAVGESCRIVRCHRESLRFHYRHSCLREGRCVALTVTFHLRPADPKAVRQAVLEAVHRRCRKQPLSLGSAGSVFKRPPGDYAGRLLEVAGVKGLKIGGARFSTKHANFIVNEGYATAEDIAKLVETAKQRVYECCHVRLEEEICIVGEPASPEG